MLQPEIIRNAASAKPELQDFLAENQAGFFQNLSFLSLLDGIPGFRPFMIALKKNEVIAATLAGTEIREGKGLKGRVSERCVIYGHPTIADNSGANEIMPALLKELKLLCRHSLFIQFRNDTSQEELKQTFQDAGFHFHDRLNLIKPIHDLDEAWADLSSSRRRQVRNSREHGLVIIDKPDIEQVMDFYSLLRDLYKFKVKKPLPPVVFFRRFHALSQESSFHGQIILCSFNDKIVGGIVCPFTPGASICEWYVCGLDQEYSDKKVYPSVAVTWAAMELGSRLGCEWFDFMGLGLPSKKYGVRDFKARFGGNWVNHGRWSHVNNPLLYAFAELGYNFLRILKRV